MGRIADFFREQSITLDGQKKTKMLSLDLQFEEMEAEITVLKSENLSLKAQVNPLQREVDRFKQKIEQGKTHIQGRMEDHSRCRPVSFRSEAQRAFRTLCFYRPSSSNKGVLPAIRSWGSGLPTLPD